MTNDEVKQVENAIMNNCSQVVIKSMKLYGRLLVSFIKTSQYSGGVHGRYTGHSYQWLLHLMNQVNYMFTPQVTKV